MYPCTITCTDVAPTDPRLSLPKVCVDGLGLGGPVCANVSGVSRGPYEWAVYGTRASVIHERRLGLIFAKKRSTLVPSTATYDVWRFTTQDRGSVAFTRRPGGQDNEWVANGYFSTVKAENMDPLMSEEDLHSLLTFNLNHTEEDVPSRAGRSAEDCETVSGSSYVASPDLVDATEEAKPDP